MLDRKRIDAVVAPIARSRKLCHWHQFDRSHAEIGQCRQMRAHAIQRSFFRIRTHMELVEDAFLEARSSPVGVSPLERRQVDDFGRAMNTIWLNPRGGIWKFL